MENIDMATKRSNMLFDVLGNILHHKSIDMYKKHISSEFFKDAAPYMVRRYLTMSLNPNVRQVVLDNYVTLERMIAEIQYKWLLDAIPKQNSTFIRYIR